MERLTVIGSDGAAEYSEHKKIYSEDVLNKLAAYEDLGYEPEELKNKLEKYKEALNKIATRKMSQYLNVNYMNRDFIETAKEALGNINE